MPQKFGRLALHMWTIDTTPLVTALDAAKQAGFDAVELRRTDFKRCVEAGMSNTEVLGLIKKSGIPCGIHKLSPKLSRPAKRQRARIGPFW